MEAGFIRAWQSGSQVCSSSLSAPTTNHGQAGTPIHQSRQTLHTHPPITVNLARPSTNHGHLCTPIHQSQLSSQTHSPISAILSNPSTNHSTLCTLHSLQTPGLLHLQDFRAGHRLTDSDKWWGRDLFLVQAQTLPLTSSIKTGLLETQVSLDKSRALRGEGLSCWSPTALLCRQL